MLKKPILILSAISAAALLLCVGCSKDDNFSKEKLSSINTEMTLFEKGVSVAMSEAMTVKLSELIKTGDNIITDASGNYSIYAAGDIQGTSIDVPEIVLDEYSFGSIGLSYSTGALAGKTITVDEHIKDIDELCEFNINDELPEGVTDIKVLNVNADFNIKISSNTEIGLLEKGFQFTFSKGFTFEKQVNDASFSVKQVDGQSVITLEEDIFPGETGKTFQVTLTQFDFTQISKPISYGRISLDGSIEILGGIGVRGTAKVPATVDIDINPSIKGNIEVQSASVKLDVETELDSKIIDIDIPDEIKKDAKILFSEPSASISIKNMSPVAFALSANLNAYKDGKKDGKAVAIKNFEVAANATSVLEINAQTYPAFKELINSLPDQIIFSDIEITNLSKDKFIDIDFANCETSVGLSYEIDTPMKVDKGSYINLDATVKNSINIDQIKAKSFSIDMEAGNGLEFDLSAQMTIMIDGKETAVSPATISLPAGKTTALTVSIAGDDVSLEQIGDITVKAKASAPSDGCKLNAEQSLSLALKKIAFPNGITITAN